MWERQEQKKTTQYLAFTKGKRQVAASSSRTNRRGNYSQKTKTGKKKIMDAKGTQQGGPNGTALPVIQSSKVAPALIEPQTSGKRLCIKGLGKKGKAAVDKKTQPWVLLDFLEEPSTALIS